MQLQTFIPFMFELIKAVQKINVLANIKSESANNFLFYEIFFDYVLPFLRRKLIFVPNLKLSGEIALPDDLPKAALLSS